MFTKEAAITKVIPQTEPVGALTQSLERTRAGRVSWQHSKAFVFIRG